MTDIVELTERALQSNDAGGWRWHLDQLQFLGWVRSYWVSAGVGERNNW